MEEKFEIYYFKEFEEVDYSHLEDIFTQNQQLELLKNNILKTFKNWDSKFYFNYVGIICTNDSLCIIFPKYFSEEEIEKEKKCDKKLKTKSIIELFKVYFSRSLNETSFFSIGEIDITQPMNKFTLYSYLISDYIEYGLYENNKEIYELNGEGEIDWEKTVNECEIYLSKKNKPIYIEYYTHEIEADNSSYIKKLHMYYLNIASKYFENLKFLELDYVVLNFFVEEENLGNLEFQILKIYQELQEQFSERKIKLLKVLLLLLENEGHKTEKSLLFYGTTSFYNVWEKTCGVVLGNQFEKYCQFISTPKWEDKNGVSLKKNFKTLIPDILVLREGVFYIFDAKYYRPDMEDETGLPGMESIGKQYLYELAFRNHPDLLNKARKNIFLIPTSYDEIKYNGKVSVDFLKRIRDVELQDILMINLPAKIVFEYYIKNEIFSPKEYEEIIKCMINF
ncbi:MAG: LlaJI family restriction endonuclease [Fusobacteriaceae bacterium]